MARTTAPLLSMDASGSIAKAITFSRWKGRSYVRRHVMPAQPRLPKQVSVRAMLAFLSRDWKNVAAIDQATWDLTAEAKAISPFNAYIGWNQFHWRNFGMPRQYFPGPALTTPAAPPTAVATGGVREISIVITRGSIIGTDWGYAIFRSSVGAVTPAFDNLIAVVVQVGLDTTFVDTPLAAGTYYYAIRRFNVDGEIAASDAACTGAAT